MPARFSTFTNPSTLRTWNELTLTFQTRDVMGQQKVVFPTSYCAENGFQLTNGECLRDPWPPEKYVVSIACVDVGDNGVERAIDPLPDSYRVADLECDNRKYAPDPASLSFGDTCMHSYVRPDHLGTTFSYFHREAEANGWRIPQLSGEHTFACRWDGRISAPRVMNPRMVFYVQHWAPRTTAVQRGLDIGYIDHGGRDFGQVLQGDTRTDAFFFRNIGFNELEFDKSSGVTVSGPSSDVTADVPVFAVNQPQPDYSRNQLHLEPPNNIIGRGGRFDFAVDLGVASPAGALQLHTVAVAPTRTNNPHFPAEAYISFTPVTQCTPEISLDNWGVGWMSPISPTTRTSLRFWNRGCMDLTVMGTRLGGADGQHFAIVDVLDHNGQSMLGMGSFALPPQSGGRIVVEFTSPRSFPIQQIEEFNAEVELDTDSVDLPSPFPGYLAQSVNGTSTFPIEVWLTP